MKLECAKEADNDLVAHIQSECSVPALGERRFCRLMRSSVWKLFEHSAAVAKVQSPMTPTLVVAFNTGPRLVRWLRIAERCVERGNFTSRVYSNGAMILDVTRLSEITRRSHLQFLAGGQIVVSGHMEARLAPCSLFVFMGIRRRDPGELTRLANAITPALHCALLSIQRSRNSLSNPLTPAEQAICYLLIRGVSNKELARALGKSESTIRNQIHSIFLKLGVTTRTAAVCRLRELQISGSLTLNFATVELNKYYD